jgi:conjugative transposon TraN protein
MKQFVMIGFLFALAGLSGKAQTSIPSYPVSISYYKTTNLIFPYAIKSVDRGSAFVLVQKAKGIDNILQLKAASKSLPMTNVTVITADGHFYSFSVSYAPDPSMLSISFARDSVSPLPIVQLHAQPIDEATLQGRAEQVLSLPAHAVRRVHSQQLQMALTAIAIDSQALWFRLELYNNCQIPFHPDYIRFFVEDRHRAKRTAIQEIDRTPLYDTPVASLGYKKHSSLAFAFTPFTIQKMKRLIIQIGERTGGRQLQLAVGSKTLLRARHLP